MNRFHARAVLAVALTTVALACGSDAAGPGPATPPPPPPPTHGVAGDGRLDEVLEGVRAGHALPALGAVLVHRGAVVELGAVGRRADDATVPVSDEDRWHLGSLTKSMTATLAAVLVERSVLDWETTVADVFPGLADDIRPQYAAASVADLLAHTTGLPEDLQVPSLDRVRDDSPLPLIERRRLWAEELLRKAPAGPPGPHRYSNAGYIVLGAMLEALTGTLWEDLLREEVFEPLGMDGVGFGAPGAPGSLEEPWGHAPQGSGWRPIPPGPGADNPAALGPAGTVHATLEAYVPYLVDQLEGAAGEAGLLSVGSYQRLRAPAPGSDYALGWAVVPRPWGGGDVLTHTGSNTLWFAVVWLAPERDFGFLVVSNAGGGRAAEGTDAMAWALVQRWLEAYGGS